MKSTTSPGLAASSFFAGRSVNAPTSREPVARHDVGCGCSSCAVEPSRLVNACAICGAPVGEGCSTRHRDEIAQIGRQGSGGFLCMPHVERLAPSMTKQFIAVVPYSTPVVTANLTELELTAQYLLAVVERIKDMPLAEQRSHLIGTCGVAADRIKYAIKQIKETK